MHISVISIITNTIRQQWLTILARVSWTRWPQILLSGTLLPAGQGRPELAPSVANGEAGRCLDPEGNGVNLGGGNGGGPSPPGGEQDKQLISSRGGGNNLMEQSGRLVYNTVVQA